MATNFLISLTRRGFCCFFFSLFKYGLQKKISYTSFFTQKLKLQVHKYNKTKIVRLKEYKLLNQLNPN